MSEIDKAHQLRRKAIAVLEKHGVIDALNWAMSQSNTFYNTDDLQVTPSRKIQGQEQSVEFLFAQNTYRLIRDNEHRSMLPEDEDVWGTVKVFENEVQVLEGQYVREPDHFLGYRDPRISRSDYSFKSIHLGDWVNRFPAAIEHAKKAQNKHMRAFQEKKDAEEAKKIFDNFNLGNY